MSAGDSSLCGSSSCRETPLVWPIFLSWKSPWSPIAFELFRDDHSFGIPSRTVPFRTIIAVTVDAYFGRYGSCVLSTRFKNVALAYVKFR